MKQGALFLTYDDIASILRLPPEHYVRAVFIDGMNDIANSRIQVLIEGPQMPEHTEGSAVQFVEIHRDKFGRHYLGG